MIAPEKIKRMVKRINEWEYEEDTPFTVLPPSYGEPYLLRVYGCGGLLSRIRYDMFSRRTTDIYMMDQNYPGYLDADKEKNDLKNFLENAKGDSDYAVKLFGGEKDGEIDNQFMQLAVKAMILPYLNEENTELVKNYMNDYRYYVIMNDLKTVKKQELEELNVELEKVIIRIQRKGNAKGILDDIEKCTDEEIQLLLRHIDTLTLSVALKGARKETAESFYRNLSVRLRYLIQEDMEYKGPVRMCDVEEAESKIIGAARNVLNWEEVLQR